ncbi:hypothetical protein C8F01DRAFT_1064710 [Mycena amicta]|nr:hypothetical protein C8F01DRAFT_1064710 [Mycena amicta]
MRWFADSFDNSFSRSQVEAALATTIEDIIQDISDKLTDPVYSELTFADNLLAKTRILFLHLDAHSRHIELIQAFQEALLRQSGISYVLNEDLRESAKRQSADTLLDSEAQAPRHTNPEQRVTSTLGALHNLGNENLIQDQLLFIRNCPPPSKFFQGRQDVLSQLDTWFQPAQQEEQIVVLLHGLGGAGKTQIALKFIADSRSRFTDQLKINAGSKETIEASYKQIAMDKNLGDKADAAQTWLKANQDEWLILFDNADKLDLDLGEHIPKCKHGNILITSRNPELWVHTGPDKKSIEISNLSANDAVSLLLKRSGLGHGNMMHAVSIVKELHCFPLAIVQAGAFISKSPPLQQDISKYLELYQQNKVEMLSKKPAQSPEDYEWTVYTTWQMSFSQLSSKARQFLQLCSFIHFEKITEDIFQRASEYEIRNGPLDPTQEQLQSAVQFLAQFSSRMQIGWNSLAFVEMISEICGYSLIAWQNNTLSIHPLVHQWSRTTIVDPVRSRKTMMALLGMAAARSKKMLQKIQLLLHLIDMLDEGSEAIIMNGFEINFARIYSAGGLFRLAEKLDKQVLEQRTRLLGAEHPDTIGAMAYLSSTYHNLGQYTKAEKLKQQVLEQQTRLLGAEHPQTIGAMASLSTTYHELGRYIEAESLDKKVLEQRTRLLGAEHPDTIGAMASVATTFHNLGKYTEAESLDEQVLEQRTRLLGAENPDTIETMANLSSTYHDLGRYKEGKQLSEQVLEQRTRLLGAEHPATIQAMANLSTSYHALGQYTEAQSLDEKVLEQRTRLLGAEHPDTIGATESLSTTYFHLGRDKEAEKLYEQVLEQRTRVLGAEHPHTIRATAYLAVTYHSLGWYTKAENLKQQVLDQQIRLLGHEHPATIQSRESLSTTYHSMERYQEAKKLDELVLEQRTRLLGAEHSDTVRAMASLAVTYYQIGRYTEAVELQEEALRKWSQMLGPEHPHTIWAIDRLSDTYIALGRHIDAEELQENRPSHTS